MIINNRGWLAFNLNTLLSWSTLNYYLNKTLIFGVTTNISHLLYDFLKYKSQIHKIPHQDYLIMLSSKNKEHKRH